MISIICPVLNEERYIEDVLEFCLKANPVDKEIIFIDGGSQDKTITIIKEYITLHANIRLLYNKDKYVPFALNIAIREAKGDIIVRLDAHCLYADDYFEAILATFTTTNADIVGGPTRTAYKSDTQEAVAYAIGTVFAVGGSRVHQENFEGLTDSVTFGAWKKEIFAETGLFDERLVRNQDDEFHYRARSFGFKIYQSPSIKLFYYPRDTLKGLFRQYFQYGLYKPLVLRKVKSGISVRHLVPAMFVLYMLFCLFVFIQELNYLLLTPLLFYFGGLFYFSFFNVNQFQIKVKLASIYPVIHFGYGLGFIAGLYKAFIDRNYKH